MSEDKVLNGFSYGHWYKPHDRFIVDGCGVCECVENHDDSSCDGCVLENTGCGCSGLYCCSSENRPDGKDVKYVLVKPNGKQGNDLDIPFGSWVRCSAFMHKTNAHFVIDDKADPYWTSGILKGEPQGIPDDTNPFSIDRFRRDGKTFNGIYVGECMVKLHLVLRIRDSGLPVEVRSDSLDDFRLDVSSEDNAWFSIVYFTRGNSRLVPHDAIKPLPKD